MMESAAGAGGPDTVHVPAEKCHACDGYYANVIIRAWGLMAELHRALRARRETPSWELRATPSAYKQFALAMLYTMAEGHKADGRTIVHRDPWLKLVLPQQTHIHRFNNEAENRLYRCNDITTGDKHVKPFLGALIREHAREHPERAHELARRALYQNVTQQYMQLQHLGSHRHHGGDDGYGGDDADPASQAASARLAHALGHVLEAKSEEPMYPYQPQQQQQQSASPPLPSDDGTLADA
jgi:hypothetical protein